MKVTGKHQPNISELTLGKAREKGQKVAPSRSGSTKQAEQVANRASLTMNKIKETIRNEPDVRTERVAELKDRLKSGKYKVDPDQVANKLVTASLREDLEKP